MQHPCIGYFLDPKCEVKSATMITDIVCVCGGVGGGRGGKLHMVPPYYQTNMKQLMWLQQSCVSMYVL